MEASRSYCTSCGLDTRNGDLPQRPRRCGGPRSRDITSPRIELLRKYFGLTAAEARLAVRLASGDTLTTAASESTVARETAHNQLKAVFAKTNTHRQSELVALLGRTI